MHLNEMDPSTPEAVEFAARVCRHWTEFVTGSPVDNQTVTGRAANWLTTQADLLRRANV